MPKINGKTKNGGSLLGESPELSPKSTAEIIDYESSLKNMDLDSLYRHGMESFGIRPPRSAKAREGFERKCIAAFRELA